MKKQHVLVSLVSIVVLSLNFSFGSASILDDSYYDSTQFLLDSEKKSTKKSIKLPKEEKAAIETPVNNNEEKVLDIQRENELIVEQLEKNYGQIEEFLVIDYTPTTPDDPDYDVAKELLIGTFDKTEEKMIEAKQVFYEPTPQKKGDFDAAKYILELEKTKDYSQYYVKPTPHSKDDFDAALFLLSQESNN